MPLSGITARQQPQSGTLRLYVDGTAGDDNASGTSWATAWKTLAKLVQGIASLLFVEPDNLTILARVRGAFSNETLQLTLSQTGTSRFYVAHDRTDHTIVQTGTIGVGGAAYDVGVFAWLRIYLGGGIVLTGAERGMVLHLYSGVDRSCFTILRSDPVSQSVWVTCDATWLTSVPDWMVSGAAAELLSPSASGIIALRYNCVHPSQMALNESIQVPANEITVSGVGLNFCGRFVASGQGVRYQAAAPSNGFVFSSSAYTDLYQPNAVIEELGFQAGIGASLLGLDVPTSQVRVDSGFLTIAGYTKAAFCTGGHLMAQQTITEMFDAEYGRVSCFGCAATGTGKTKAYYVRKNGELFVRSKSGVIDIPATGLTDGLILIEQGAYCEIDNTVTGENTGTATSGLVAVHIRSGGRCVASALSTSLTGKHGRIKNVGGSLIFTAALTAPAFAGGGPDMYCGPDGSIQFDDNVTKSAVNSETAIQSGVDGQITAVTKQFTSATAVFTSTHVGRSIKISNTINAGNVGVHLITAFVDANNVTLGNMAAPVNEGPGLTWGLVGTPRSIIECARGGKVTQAAGKTFTVRIPGVEPAPGSGLQEWSKQGYGDYGFVHQHEGADVVLGTVALSGAGAANANGIAGTLRNASRLMHTGGAVVLGTAPLKLGGAAAQAWPAAPTSDLAAGVPEGCWIYPNVT